MPKPLWTYLIALLHFTKVSTCSAIAEIVPKASHDCWTMTIRWRRLALTCLANGIYRSIRGEPESEIDIV